MGLDNSLVEKISQGDSVAFRSFFNEFYPSIYLFAIKFIKQSDVAEDFVQDAFVQFWKIRERFSDIRQVQSFIYTSTRNACLNYLKQKRVREEILKEMVDLEEMAYELIIEEETFRKLHNAISLLPHRTREVMLLSLKGNTNPDIAKKLNISLNTVKTLKKNAYKELRIKLKDQFLLLIILKLSV